MGLLDDAIREHLDLKRRRGADPTEVERAEREALGPVRRGPEPQSAEVTAGTEPADNVESDQEWHEEPFGEEPDAFAPPAAGRRRFSPSEMFKRSAPPPAEESPVSEERPLAEEPRIADEPALGDEPPPPQFTAPPESTHDFHEDPLGDPFAEDDHPGTPPPHAAPASPPAQAVEPAGGETVEYRIDEEPDSRPKKDGEDVLEETPEFLEDTPDHDRLWFEQRPPKDFDFEG